MHTTALAEYLNNLRNSKEPKEKLHFKPDDINNQDTLPPTKEEICEIISELKSIKAVSKDSNKWIIAELWKHADEDLMQGIQKFISDIWVTQALPSNWISATIHYTSTIQEKRHVWHQKPYVMVCDVLSIGNLQNPL